MKVVIDTNVVISAALGSRTCSMAIIKALEQEVIEPGIFPQELRWKSVETLNWKLFPAL